MEHVTEIRSEKKIKESEERKCVILKSNRG